MLIITVDSCQMLFDMCFEFLGLKSLHTVTSIFAFNKGCDSTKILETFQFNIGIFKVLNLPVGSLLASPTRANEISVNKPFSMLIFFFFF